ncbi:spore germination protein GerPC [Aquibacillus koreensis]|uniref:Spore germination protein GerPC n=1 Tax=Aquibacillus koreensis TaxID=279446 RepID=A0A9X3WMN8_9BACI|nr:spore germination protein GerPC [Aquibacillus koreensis]MCT2535609.1 spore germination protein GerPC [Aquibacillus koreensis]MDC3420106.1 spore germination protein GerPC [Aquibacillus koreensis]
MRYTDPWSEYLSQLQQYVEQQTKKLEQLEARVHKLENDQTNKHHTTIEKLEYNFDQLKIERLDGTLHIGISPDDLSKIDDVAFPQSPPTSIPNNQSAMKHQLIADLDIYLNEQGPHLLQQYANNYNYPMNDSFQALMLDDVRKQLPERIKYYEEEAHNNRHVTTEKDSRHYIFDQIKREIDYSLKKFFEQDQSKGE